MRDLTLVMPHFCNVGMFAEHQRVWMDYPADLRRRLHVIVVDDCSPKGARLSRKAVTVSGLGSLRIYRLTQKQRWNWLAARNLGAAECQTEWLLLTDIDHVLPADTLRRLVDGELREAQVYRFSRVDAPHPWPYAIEDCVAYKHHPDTWLMTKAMFFHPGINGYDERLSGLYGTSGEFKDRVQRTAAASVRLTDVIVRYPREIIADASTSPAVYTRKNDVSNDEELRKRKAARDLIANWQPLHGLIPHELVYDSVAAEVAA